MQWLYDYCFDMHNEPIDMEAIMEKSSALSSHETTKIEICISGTSSSEQCSVLVQSDDDLTSLESVISLPNTPRDSRQERDMDRRLQLNRPADLVRHRSPFPDHRRTFRDRNYRDQREVQESEPFIMGRVPKAVSNQTATNSTSNVECDPCIGDQNCISKPTDCQSSESVYEPGKRVVRTRRAAPSIMKPVTHNTKLLAAKSHPDSSRRWRSNKIKSDPRGEAACQ